MGIFQLLHGDTGLRSNPMQCTVNELVQVLETQRDVEGFDRQYVLCLMQDCNESGDWQYSLFPMVGVSEFLALNANMLAEGVPANG